MAESAARLLQLLTLLQARPSWTGAELAERLEVTDRTLRRDVDRLRNLGYPVHAERGSAGGYRLGRGGRLPPLLLGDDEAIATAIALRAAAGGGLSGPAGQAGQAEAAAGALAKLEQVLPERLRHQVGAIGAAATTLPRAAAPLDLDTFAALALACGTRHRVRFRYTDHHGRVGTRHAEPYRLVHSGRHWYLAADDLDRRAWRVFRVDRIDGVLDTGRRFVPAAQPDAVGIVAAAVATGPYQHRATVLLHVPADRAAEDFPAAVGVLEPLGPDSCRLSVAAGSVADIVMHLSLLDYDFTILTPAELRTRVREVADRFRRAAQPPGMSVS